MNCLLQHYKVLYYLKKTLTIVNAWLTFSIVKIITLFIPLKVNKYFCISMSGNNYGDNVKSLSDYIKENNDVEIIWAFTPSYYNKVITQYTKVRLYSFFYYYHLLTSKFILSNARLNHRMLHKRKGQIYLQTWHGTALKHIGSDVKYSERDVIERIKRIFENNIFLFDVKNTDIMVSGSQYMSRIFRDKFNYCGSIIETGTPRNDIFFHSIPEIDRKVRESLHISKSDKIILYAPTFRNNNSLDFYNIDIMQLKKCWEKKDNNNYVVLFRLHPNLLFLKDEVEKRFPMSINASLYPDMQELLYVSDILVTDYSSSMFDFMYTHRPIIVYVPDWDIYDRGVYFSQEQLPFIIIKNNCELDYKINDFDNDLYKQKVDKFIHYIGSVESGNACEDIYSYLNIYIKNEK